MANGPLSRDAYVVEERFTDTVGQGKDYLKVRYKGIGTVGYLSRVAGPGRSISKRQYQRKKKQQPDEQDTFDVTVTIEKEYEPDKRSRFDEWEARLEITGTYKADSEEAAENRGRNKMRQILSFASEQIPPLNPDELEIRSMAQATEARPTGWFNPPDKPVLEIEFSYGTYEYVVDVEAGTIPDFEQ